MSRGRFSASNLGFIAALSRFKKYGGGFHFARRASRMSRGRFHFSLPGFNVAFLRLPKNKPASFATDSLSFLGEHRLTRNDEDIVVTRSNESVHRAALSVDVPAKIADVFLYPTRVVQKM